MALVEVPCFLILSAMRKRREGVLFCWQKLVGSDARPREGFSNETIVERDRWVDTVL